MEIENIKTGFEIYIVLRSMNIEQVTETTQIWQICALLKIFVHSFQMYRHVIFEKILISKAVIHPVTQRV